MQVNTIYMLSLNCSRILYLVYGHVLNGRRNMSRQRKRWKVWH